MAPIRASKISDLTSVLPKAINSAPKGFMSHTSGALSQKSNIRYSSTKPPIPPTRYSKVSCTKNDSPFHINPTNKQPQILKEKYSHISDEFFIQDLLNAIHIDNFDELYYLKHDDVQHLMPLSKSELQINNAAGFDKIERSRVYGRPFAEELFKAIDSEDFDRIRDFIHDDITYDRPLPKSKEGKEEVLRLRGAKNFMNFYKKTRDLDGKHEVKFVWFEKGKLNCYGTFKGKKKSSGDEVSTKYIDQYKIIDGKITSRTTTFIGEAI